MEERLEKTRQCVELVRVKDPRLIPKSKDEGRKDGQEVTGLRLKSDNKARYQNLASCEYQVGNKKHQGASKGGPEERGRTSRVKGNSLMF